MPFSTEFYRRRLERKLETDNGVRKRAVHSEASLLAVPDDTEFVRHAYRFYLHRDPDLGGLQYFGDMLDRLGRLAVVAEIKNSDEGRRLAATPRGFRREGEGPAQAEAQQAGRLVEPTPPVLAAAPASTAAVEIPPADGPVELSDLMGIQDPVTFLKTAYVRTLGREPDQDGFAHHLRRLQEGESRELLLHSFATSTEAVATGRHFTWQGQPWRGPSFGARARAAARRLRPGTSRRKLDARLEDVVRSHARLQQTFVEQRDRHAEIVQSVANQVAAVERLSLDLTTLAQSMGSASSDASQELQRLRAGQQALRASTEALAARLRQRPSEASRASVVAGDNVVATLVDGFIVGVPGEEWRLAAFHAFRGVLEPGLTKRFCASLKPGMVVVDIGANIGMYTLNAARIVAPTGRVYSFEPTPRIFTILKDNIQVNGFLETGVVHFRRVAVTDRQGKARLGVYRSNNGHNTLFPAESDAEVIEVETTSLDEALAGVPRVDVMKIDAEGSEPLIWDGMVDTLRRSPQVRIFMEFGPGLLERAGHDPAGFLRRIGAAGFTIHYVDDETGALSEWTRDQLTAATSVNVMLARSTR